jgi:hypothetical protein
MGEFTDVPGPAENQPDNQEQENQDTRIQTDVEGVFANDVIKQGHNEFPVFDCTEEEFYQNMSHGRKRLRFKSGTAAAEYMNKTRYKRPFYIRTTSSDGQTYTRKVK